MAKSPVAAKKTAKKKAAPSRRKGRASTGSRSVADHVDLQEVAQLLEKKSPLERIEWGLESYQGRAAMSSSFGAQSAVSLHMITQLAPEIPVILIDTGYLFEETYEFIGRLTDRLDLNLKVYSNPMSPAWQEAKFGKLWEDGIEGIEKYNQMNKVEPMERALGELDVAALFSGIRRSQSATRENMPVVVSQRNRVKVHPIVDWTDMQVGTYLVDHNLPYHPLWSEGYVSIGDWHTSHKLTDGMSEEETRFFGLKRECGLNEDVDFQI